MVVVVIKISRERSCNLSQVQLHQLKAYLWDTQRGKELAWFHGRTTWLYFGYAVEIVGAVRMVGMTTNGTRNTSPRLTLKRFLFLKLTLNTHERNTNPCNCNLGGDFADNRQYIETFRFMCNNGRKSSRKKKLYVLHTATQIWSSVYRWVIWVIRLLRSNGLLHLL